MRREFVIGVDLAQQHDYTAIAVVERRPAPGDDPPAGAATYDLVHLERFRGRPYPWVVARVAEVERATFEAGGGWRRPDAWGRWVAPDIALVVDKTGVGAGVTDHMRAAGLAPIDVTITAGDRVHPAEHGYTVPKVDLATGVQLLLQSGRLRFAAELPDLEALKRELAGFRVRISLTGRVSFAAAEEWRMGDGHDDLILSVALAAWVGEYDPTPVLRPASPDLLRYFPGLPR
jgi:hypothetical protein